MKFQFEITQETSGLRLDKALSLHPNIGSRSQAARLIDEGLVRFKNRTPRSAFITTIGDIFEVEVPEPVSRELTPLELKLDIVYEDESLIVINKPPGLVVHPAAGHQADTLVNALLHHTNQLSTGFEADRPGIVHRLDKDTSGLIVIAKNDGAHRILAQQFKKKSVHRIYWAIVFGTFKNSKGTIQTFLKRHPGDRKKFASEKIGLNQIPTGKIAITHYEVKKTHPSGLTLIHLKLETGRTHQIRVHMSEGGHPLLADPIYTSSGRSKSIKSTSLRKAIDDFPRLCLHAAELGFLHPVTEKYLVFHSPWPMDLIPHVEKLGFS